MALQRFTKFQLATHVAALAPLALLAVAALTNHLTVNPIQAATLRTGKTALVLLVLSLACTPANTVFGFTQAIRVRRALGLYAFLYAAIHFSIFFGVDYRFDVGLIWLELAEKRYILVGAAALLIMIPLAVTSTKSWQRRLKKTWKRLHQWVYAAGALVMVHYLWVQKSDIREPLIWGSVLSLLLLLRVPPIRHRVVRWRTAIRSKLRRSETTSPHRA